MESNKGCFFCSKANSFSLEKERVYISLGRLIGGSNILNVFVRGYEAVSNKSVDFTINYCPICGREL